MNNYTVTCIVGLPGSGKTWLAYQLAQGQSNIEVIDDMRFEEQLPEILDHHIIITDPFFCDIEVRHGAEMAIRERYGVEIKWIFYEISVEKCLRNISHRNEPRDVMTVFWDMAEVYGIPDGIEPLEIWDSGHVV
jgi:GTPase SAR1 family protein